MASKLKKPLKQCKILYFGHDSELFKYLKMEDLNVKQKYILDELELLECDIVILDLTISKMNLFNQVINIIQHSKPTHDIKTLFIDIMPAEREFIEKIEFIIDGLIIKPYENKEILNYLHEMIIDKKSDMSD